MENHRRNWNSARRESDARDDERREDYNYTRRDDHNGRDEYNLSRQDHNGRDEYNLSRQDHNGRDEYNRSRQDHNGRDEYNRSRRDEYNRSRQDYTTESRERLNGQPREYRRDKPTDNKPNYKLSGALVKDQLSVDGVVLKYSEPPEARKPTVRYRLYVYKNGKEKSIIKIDKQSCYLLGKESISDIVLEHESCSKQHAALQYRMVDGHVKLYIIDLKSSNGTLLNKRPIPQKRFVELRSMDILGFGASSREYVLIEDDS